MARINEYSHFYCYRDEFDSFDEANLDGAVYSTPSTIDALALQLSSTSGILDLSEVISTVTECLGIDGIKWGVKDHHGNFINSDNLLEEIKSPEKS